MVFEILNKIAQILNKKEWAKTEENVNNITKIMKNFKINIYYEKDNIERVIELNNDIERDHYGK